MLMRIYMQAKIKVIVAIMRLGRAARTTLIITRRYFVGLVQQLYSDINITIVYFKISGIV